MQLVRNIQELLQQLVLFSLSDFVLLGPSRVQLFIESVDFIFLLDDDVIDLDFDAVTSLLQEISLLFLGELIDRFDDAIDLRVA